MTGNPFDSDIVVSKIKQVTHCIWIENKQRFHTANLMHLECIKIYKDLTTHLTAPCLNIDHVWKGGTYAYLCMQSK
jgi:hypothetical protein